MPIKHFLQFRDFATDEFDYLLRNVFHMRMLITDGGLTIELSAPRTATYYWHFIPHGRAPAIC